MLHRRLTVPAAALITVLALAGCGGGSDEVTLTKDGSGVPMLDITVKNGEITPDGAKVEIQKGKPLKLHVVADAKGELHVHSEPEREIAYGTGTTTTTLTLDQPGVVDVEDHALDKLVVQLEVR